VDNNRYIRLRELVRGVNRQRKIQARKIDILCTDMVSAHRSILDRLEGLTFTNSLYESLVGCSGAAEVLEAISALFADRFGHCGIAIATLDEGGITLHDTHAGLGEEVSQLPSFFTAENIRALCAANRILTLAELLELPVEIPPKTAERATAAAVPLRLAANATGLLLLYNDVEKQLPPRLIHSAAAIAPAIARTLATSHSVA
jgi:hypothetical protein